jgi:hypothetical protein
MVRRKSFDYAVVLTADHVFDKVRALDLTLGEFESLLDPARSSRSTRSRETRSRRSSCYSSGCGRCTWSWSWTIVIGKNVS